jgi:hypothetical protein
MVKDIQEKESITADDKSDKPDEKDRPAIIRDAKVKLDAKNTEKATGMEVTNPTILNNIDVSVAAENVKEAVGFTNQCTK